MTLLLAAGSACLLWGPDIRKWKPVVILAHWRTGLFLFYLSFLLISTVFARERINPCGYVLTHFGFRRNDVVWNNEIIENILFFIPYSVFFLAAFRPAKPLLSAFTVSAVTSCVIELSQLILWLGEFQLSDIFHNILGGIIGCGLWLAVKRVPIKAGVKRIWERRKSNEAKG